MPTGRQHDNARAHRICVIKCRLTALHRVVVVGERHAGGNALRVHHIRAQRSVQVRQAYPLLVLDTTIELPRHARRRWGRVGVVRVSVAAARACWCVQGTTHLDLEPRDLGDQAWAPNLMRRQDTRAAPVTFDRSSVVSLRLARDSPSASGPQTATRGAPRGG